MSHIANDVPTSVKNILVYLMLSTFSLDQGPLELQQPGYLGGTMTTVFATKGPS